jgi:chitodextrinase
MSILALTSDTLVTAASGQIEYNGQFFGTDSNASRAQLQRLTQGTAVASTSGTSIDFNSLPAWVKKITVMFNGVSTNGTSATIIQLGDSGGIETTGYLGSMSYQGGQAFYTTGIGVNNTGSATVLRHGSTIITLVDSSTNTWSAMGVVGTSGIGSGETYSSGSAKSLSATLDRVRITAVNGTDTFDAGSINILYEG